MARRRCGVGPQIFTVHSYAYRMIYCAAPTVAVAIAISVIAKSHCEIGSPQINANMLSAAMRFTV